MDDVHTLRLLVAGCSCRTPIPMEKPTETDAPQQRRENNTSKRALRKCSWAFLLLILN